MSKIIKHFSIIAIFSLILFSPLLSAQPTKESLIEAWEVLIKSDPDTIVFEKLEENLYKYKTDILPFDGQLKILNTIIEKRETVYDDDNNVVWGAIETELVNLPEDFIAKHPYSYPKWQRNNTLYFDNDSERWLTQKEFFAQKKDELQRSPLRRNPLRFLYGNITVIVLVFVTLLLIIFTNRIQKKTERNIKKSFILADETNRLLTEILAEIKKIKNKETD